MITREELLQKLANDPKWDVGVAINRTNPVPTDATAVVESVEALNAYATSNPIAYPGQIVTVLGETEIAAYLIKTVGENSVISKLAASTASGDIATDVENLKTQVAKIISGEQVVGAATKATQDGAGNVIATTYATVSALNDVKTTAEQGVTDAAAAKSAADAAKEVADAKIGAVSLASGTNNGTLKLTIDGTATDNIAVTGLGSAAYKADTAFDAAGKAEELVNAHNSSNAAHSDIRESITALSEKVSGRATNYVFANKLDAEYVAAIGKAGSFGIGDTIYFTDTNIPDEWVTAVNESAPFYTFQEIETEKPDLSGYVKDTRKINGKDLKADITLGVADISGAASTTDVSTAKEEVLGTVDTKLENYVTNTTLDGKGYITKEVNNLTNYTTTTELNTALGNKQDKNQTLTDIAALEGTGLVKKTADGVELDTNSYLVEADLTSALEPYAKSADVTSEIETAVADKQTAAQVNALIAAATIDGSKVNGAVASATNADTAAKVANKLTVGDKEFDGSTAVEITAADLGAITAIPEATAEALGGIKVGFNKAGNKLPVQLEEGKAFVEIPAAVQYQAGDGLALDSATHTFSIAENGVVSTMIADNSVTNAKIQNVNVMKLEQGEADILVLNGGNATA